MPSQDQVLITCEHGGNRIPPRYRAFFAGHEALLAGHRGYDPGALKMAHELARGFAAPLFVSATSRLLVDLNRSIGHAKLHGEALRAAPAALRREILARYYIPYRQQVEAAIAARVETGQRVIHIASHSFRPVLDGEVRKADIGLLYDPARVGERGLCECWQRAFKTRARDLQVRRNYPYAGKSDGFTSYLRRRFPAGQYVGVELEINQRHVFAGGRHWRALRGLVMYSLREVLAGGEAGP